MGWREVGNLPAAVRLSGPASLAKVARARVPADLWSAETRAGVAFDEWDPSRVTVAAPAFGVRTLSTNTCDQFFRWRFGGDLLRYRVQEFGDGAVVFRVRQRGPARELVHVSSIGLGAADTDRAICQATSRSDVDYAIRLGHPNARRAFVPLPGGGPVLTWRALNEQGMPPLSNWNVTMGDIELF
eukprot:gene37117-60358_t